MRISTSLFLLAVGFAAAQYPDDEPMVDPSADYTPSGSMMMPTTHSMMSTPMTTSMPWPTETDDSYDDDNTMSHWTTTWTTTEADGMVMTYVSSCTGDEWMPEPTPMPMPTPEAPMESTPAPLPPVRPAPVPSAPPAAPTYPSSPSIVPATGWAAQHKVEMGVAFVMIVSSLGMQMLW